MPRPYAHRSTRYSPPPLRGYAARRAAQARAHRAQALCLLGLALAAPLAAAATLCAYALPLVHAIAQGLAPMP